MVKANPKLFADQAATPYWEHASRRMGQQHLGGFASSPALTYLGPIAQRV
jgi:hypothetical protein